MSDSEALGTKEHTEAHGDKIKTYRKLDDHQIKAINKVKELEQEIAALFDGLGDETELNPRDRAMARTHFEDGCIRLTRAIAKPVSPFD